MMCCRIAPKLSTNPIFTYHNRRSIDGTAPPLTHLSMTPLALRHACRTGEFDGPTSGHAAGFVQGNLAVLPAALARDFREFCRRNPKPCPVIGVSEPGNPHLAALGADLDIRTDLPRYCVWKNGELIDQPADITS